MQRKPYLILTTVLLFNILFPSKLFSNEIYSKAIPICEYLLNELK